VKFTTDVSGDDYFSGTGILTTYDISGGLGEAATYSFTFEGDGAITRSTT
jgi:predicted secreted protein